MRKKRTRLLKRLFLSYVIIISLCLTAAWFFTSDLLRSMYYEETESMLKTQAQLVRNSLGTNVGYGNADKVNDQILSLNNSIDTRITIILSDGYVIADSDKEYHEMDNHSNRPEIIEALNGGTGISTRYSNTLKKDLMYVAIPLLRGNEKIGIIRTSMPVATINNTLNRHIQRIAMVIMFIALSAAIASFIVSQWIVQPVGDLIKGVSHFARGELDHRIPVRSSDELGLLTESINDMARQINDHVHEIVEQQSELEAILSGMAEAIIVVDNDLRVIEFNQAAVKYLDKDPKIVRGTLINEVIETPHLPDFAKRTLAENSLLEDEIVLYDNSEITLQAHGTQFLDVNGDRIGGIIVLNDISRIKQLENIRREFVGNVSHELKTPITSIIGFVETLNDGAINDFDNRQQFLDIIMKHARRLNSIIEDLLSISRIEAADGKEMEFEETKLNEVLNNAVQLCENEAKNKHILLELDCDNLLIKCNAALLEQAVVNLVDNAVKYSEADTTVYIEGVKKGSTTVIAVTDSGYGIPEESLSRIFERFYRVDKGRSRAKGGTGLGLSIVKHIVNAHNGRIEVESTPGKGSRFNIFLPTL